MLSHLVRAQLAAELLLYEVAGAWLNDTYGLTFPVLAAAAVLCVLGSRLALVCASTMLSYAWRSPRPPAARIGAAGIAALVLREWRAMLANNFWRLPFDGLALRPDPAPRRGGPVPVLLVHGYVSNRGLLRPLVTALESAGATQLFTLNFRGIFCPIEELAAQLDAEVGRLLAATGHERLVLVGHSMGGLVARTWLASAGAGRVARLVTLASPHHGTALAKLGRGRNARQMRRGSELLSALESAEGDRGPGCPATSVYSLHDNLVAPQDTSRLPWARNVELHGLGHVEIVGAEPVVALVVEELRAGGALG